MSDLNADLIRSIIQGETAIVETLLNQGADPNTTGGVTPVGASNTALMWTATEGHTEIVRHLLDRGATVTAKNAAGFTALIQVGAAIETANLGGWVPVMMAAARGDLDTIELLLKHGADVRPVNRWGATALSEARNSFRSTQAVELLLRAGAID
jgi:uncharacterized protein